LTTRLPPISPLFPYTTLFRSRHDQLAAPDIGIADQVEGGIGRQETVAAPGAEQMLRAVADRGVDLRGLRHGPGEFCRRRLGMRLDRKSTRLNSSHVEISYAVF